MRALYRRHDTASRTKYQDTTETARIQERVLTGTPGTLKQRTQAGKQYWVREHIRVDSAKVDEYYGPVASTPKSTLDRLHEEVDLARTLATRSGALRLLGFQRVEKKPAAVLAVFFNQGLFQAGLTLVGSHAYGTLLNELGLMAPAYRTKDLDVARSQALQIALPPGKSFASMLNDTGLHFVAVPGMPSHRPSASFKIPGTDDLLVDLLVPGREVGKIVPVSELAGHAQTIPFLDFLVEDPLNTVVLSPNQVIPANVPAPERFVLHKLYSSQSRRTDPSKSAKDLEQAATIAAALEEELPGRLLDVWKRFPSGGKSALGKAAKAASRLLEKHPEAASLFEAIAKR